ncbi:MAG TPA: phosphoribosylanthranilate isomerase [Solirubrobacteraceae bacterium]|jgi:phosphoribosylanthranilate isomerase|nr:phosphoribosylanthranilate isomerase [Solirubrobacteraceae bacterium]
MKAPKIKFCGITREQDAELAVSLDAWAVGMIMWPHSPRAVPLDRAAGLAALLKRRAEIVGVFVNPTLDEITATADAVGLTMLQLHGEEGPAFCTEVARRTGCKVIKAARVQSLADIQALAAYHTDFHLYDSYKAGVPGGTGETFAWELAAGRGRVAPPRRKGQQVPLILSGGLTPANVADAIAAIRPYAVDVASGVESAPGYKDGDKMRAFAEAVAATATAEPAEPEEAEREAVGHEGERSNPSSRNENENENQNHSHTGSEGVGQGARAA